MRRESQVKNRRANSTFNQENCMKDDPKSRAFCSIWSQFKIWQLSSRDEKGRSWRGRIIIKSRPVTTWLPSVDRSKALTQPRAVKRRNIKPLSRGCNILGVPPRRMRCTSCVAIAVCPLGVGPEVHSRTWVLVRRSPCCLSDRASMRHPIRMAAFYWLERRAPTHALPMRTQNRVCGGDNRLEWIGCWKTGSTLVLIDFKLILQK